MEKTVKTDERQKEAAGVYSVKLEDGSGYTAVLPGTLDENGIGGPDGHAVKWHPDDELALDNEANTGLHIDGVITTRLTRRHTYTGPAVFERLISPPEKEDEASEEETAGGTRIFLEAERSRRLFLSVNGRKIPPFNEETLSTPCVFELTGTLRGAEGGMDRIVFTCDNSYPGWPASSILYSSAATDETQTNWNGITGRLLLRTEKETIIRYMTVLPQAGIPEKSAPGKDESEIDAAGKDWPEKDGPGKDAAGKGSGRPVSLTVRLMLHASRTVCDKAVITCEALEKGKEEREISLKEGDNELVFSGLKLKKDVRLWDEYEGNLYELSLEGCSFKKKTVSVGIRTFCQPRSPYLTINGRRIFLRCETNCAVFPETGHPPMDRGSWDRIMETYRAYGVNCVRFHSWCPPEAAFAAADRAGILCMPELSNWDPCTAFSSPEAKQYYREELFVILKTYGSHPSFVMLSLGNELHYADEDAGYVRGLLQDARSFDPTRLYMNGSNAFYGEKGTDPDSDCYTSCFYFSEDLRGTSSGMRGPINHELPSSQRCFDDTLSRIRSAYDRPVFAFEVGQYQTLPDFTELPLYRGVTVPDNLKTVRDRAEALGLAGEWEKRVCASGELALECYRAEYEAILATREYSGISILGLQDFPGQGTALIGMMHAHLQPKKGSFAQPERFRSFFRPVLPMLRLPRFTYSENEEAEVGCILANYGKSSISGRPELYLCLADAAGPAKEKRIYEVCGEEAEYPQGELTELLSCRIPLRECLEKAGVRPPQTLLLEIRIGEHCSSRRIWVYPEPAEMPADLSSGTDGIIVTGSSGEALRYLREGRKVFLSPPADQEHMPSSIETCFSTDLWSVGTYTYQEGYMGLLTDPSHPALASFPTAFHADWQWWRITTKARAFILPAGTESVIEALDCYARLRNLSFLSEFRVGTGRLMLCGMGLLEKRGYPEAEALLSGILRYMAGTEFDPGQEMSEDLFEKLVRIL